MSAPSITLERVRHDLKFRVAEVVETSFVTPHMKRVVLTSPDFEGFESPGYDDHVKLFFASPGSELVMPVAGPNGPEIPLGVPRPEGRDYTPRFFDPATNELTIDFVIHGHGVASSWAANARPGDRLGVGGPRGSFMVRGQADWYLLVGDETALPAIGRRIEELPAGADIYAFIEVLDLAEQQSFHTAANLNARWIVRDPQAPGQFLAQSVENADLPDGTGYAFIAGEAEMSKRVRAHLVDHKGFDPAHVRAVGYWHKDESDFYDGHEH